MASFAIASFAQAPLEAQPEPIAIAYRAPEGCPDAASFLREITARTQRARPVRTGERARVMHVTIASSGKRHDGRFWIEDDRGSSSVREVTSESCSELVRVLGLVAALAVDPQASTAPAAPATVVTPPTGTSPATAAQAGSATPDAAAPPPTEVVPERPVPAAAASSAASSPASRATLRIAASAGAGGEIAMVADAVPSLRLFVDVAFGTDVLFAPSTRLAISRSATIERSAAIGRAEMTLTTASLDLCPVRFDVAASIVARPCAGIGGGFLDASGAGIQAPEQHTRPWVAATATGRVVWAPWAALGFEVEGGVILPLIRESFYFQPNVAIYEAPAAAFLGRIGVAVRFR